jgi:hypothetical protein
MAPTCSTLWEKRGEKGRNYFGDLDIDMWIILKCMYEKYDVN